MSVGLLFDGPASVETPDRSGETLSIKGADITDLNEGRGLFNWEHLGAGEAKLPPGEELVGRVVFAKKIYSEEDCTTDRQRKYWKRLELPFIYVIGRLFDAAGHRGAQALAAQMRDFVANGEPLVLGMSVEGSTLEKDGNQIKKCIVRKIAITAKPCNAAAKIEVLRDPKAPEGFDPEPAKDWLKEDVRKAQDQIAGRVALSEEVLVEYNPFSEQEELQKALEAGNMNAAPSALVGGSALQAEDKSLKNRFKAAVRDWDGKVPFRKYLDEAMPEVDPEYLDRFAELAEDVTVKKVRKNLLKSYVTKKVVEEILAKATKKDPLTIRGNPVKPNRDMVPVFDEHRGILHTSEGSFPVYLPQNDKHDPKSADKFKKILEAPQTSKFHDRAMANWVKLHQRLKEGTLPPEVVHHAMAFSLFSPNTPVPQQELQFSHLMDAIKDNPGSSLTNLSENLRRDWLSRDRPDSLPRHSPLHFKRIKDALTLRNASLTNSRKPGDIQTFQMPGQKFDYLSSYPAAANHVVDLVNRHRADVRSAAEEMMNNKVQAQVWAARQRRNPAAGPFPGAPVVTGLGNKTTRYAMAMLGGGNVVVPDTHFLRHLFGLEQRTDGPTIEHLKQTLWNERNIGLLRQLDNYYLNNHPAVEHMLEHPKWGHYFEKPEDALFPAFWKHWNGIVPHEMSRGMFSQGYNEGTDHRPYWDAIAPYMKKSEQAETLPERTAKIHREWADQYGEMPAMMLYYTHLVPQLLQAAAQREQQEAVVKFESLLIDLRKSDGYTGVGPIDADNPPSQNPGIIEFQGKKIKPGRASVNARAYLVVANKPDHYLAIPEKPAEGETVVKLMHKDKGTGYKISDEPMEVDTPAVVKEEHLDPIYVKHPETQALVHGMSLSGPKKAATRGFFGPNSFWTKNAQGKTVYVKGGYAGDVGFSTAHKEATYHNLAKDFFGMGKYVVPTTVIADPRSQGGRHLAVVEHTPGAHLRTDDEGYVLPNGNQKDHLYKLHELHKSGELHKMALMNAILDNGDRHEGNWLYDPKSKNIKLIDHGNTLDGSPWTPMVPHYLKAVYGIPDVEKQLLGDQPRPNGHDEYNDQLHPAAQKWLESLDPQQLEAQMQAHRVPPHVIEESVRRLVAMQQDLKNPHLPPEWSIGHLLEAPFTDERMRNL